MSAPNIIVSARGGTAYLANLPLWTPKDALYHPLTAEFNRIPRFTSESLRSNGRLARAMNKVTSPRPLNCPLSRSIGPNVICGDPSDKVTGQNRVGASLPGYTGSHFVTNVPSSPVDSTGAHFDGYGVSSTQYQLHGKGQNPLQLYKSTATNYGSGKYQYGTTTMRSFRFEGEFRDDERPGK